MNIKKSILIFTCLSAVNISSFLIKNVVAQESSFVQAVIKDSDGNLDKLERIISEHEKLLVKYPNGDFATTVMFQLAELYQKQASIVFQNEMTDYERALDKYDRGELTQEPIMPRISLQKSIEYCYKILRDYPNNKFKDKILYKLAMAYSQEGNYRKAKSYFEQIITEHPQSPITLESHFRLGDYYFSKRDFSNAILHYKALLEKWDNPYFDMALYKLGWSYYNVNDYTNSISTFLYLIEDISLLERTKSQILGKTKADLTSESIFYIASCFTEFGGADAAKEFLLPLKDKDYSLDILLNMAELYQKRNYYPEAISSYRIITELYPYYEKSPSIYRQIVTNYELDERIEKANDVRNEIVYTFGPSGNWLQKYTDGPLYEEGIKISKEMLYYLATYYQAEAQKNDRVRDYHLAIQKYKEYLNLFPNADDADKIQYYLAECFYSAGDYENAAKTYHNVVNSYYSSSYREEAAFNRILSYYQLTGSDKLIESVTIYIDEFLGTGEILPVKVGHQSEIDLLRACNDFCRIFPESKWLDQVLMNFGETLHELQEYSGAVKVYKKVMELGVDNPYHLTAAMNAGQSCFDGGFYGEANMWFNNIVTNFPDSTRFYDKALRLSLSSKYKMAEQMSDQGDVEAAAELLNNVAVTSDDPAFQERAYFEAANQYQKANDFTRAALSLEHLVKNVPSSQLADEALYKAAGLRENNEEWTLASANYMTIVNQYTNSKFALQALKNAARCYENIEDWFTAKATYQKVTELFPNANDDLIESYYKIGELCMKIDDGQQAMMAYQKAISSFDNFLNSGQEVDGYYAAHSQFMIGELLFDDYKNLQLTPPLDRNLKLKVAKFKNVFNAYKNTLEYQVADWSTAASFRIGMAFEEFVRAFMESPRPEGLEGEDLELYNEKLAETAKPYKEKALETYKKNVQQAELNQIENNWIAESKKRMQVLVLELGLGDS